MVVLPSIRRSAINIFRGDERQWHSRLQCLDDKMQHENDKELETAKHFYDADFSKDLSLLDLLGHEVSGSNKLLLHRYS